MKYLYWALLWPLMFAIGLLARFLSPVACLFVVRKTDGHDDLVNCLNWFGTDDDDVSEYWYGAYPLSKYFTQLQYDNSAILRWFMRVCWLQRNSAYRFNRKFFGLEKGSQWAWQYKAQLPLYLGYYNDINIGYKSHLGIDRLMYAGRILGLRKYA